jgi:hypothetical protein
VDQHLGTKIHKEKKQTPNTLVQQLFTNNQAVKNSPQENFSKDLTNLFVSLNIPLHKIDHPLFQQFFKTYCPDSKILSSSTLRKKFVDSNYISVMAAIKEEVVNQFGFRLMKPLMSKDVILQILFWGAWMKMNQAMVI